MWWRRRNALSVADQIGRPDRGDRDDRAPTAIAALRRRVVERLQWVNDLTRGEVIAAGHSLGEIVEGASKHIAVLRDVLGRVAGDDNPLSRSIAEQVRLVRDHVSDMGERIAAHDAYAQKASARASSTLAAAEEISTLARHAKMLAINARIEAARAGEGFRAFSVIAHEMAKLSDAVAVANVQVQRLASELGELMPVMAEQTADLRARAEQFAGAATDQMKELERHVDSMRSDVTATAAASDETLAKVIAGSHAALSHLQFQDVAAQRVLHVDNWLHDVEIELRDGDATDVTPPVHVEEGGGHVDDSLAGVVQLF